MPVVRPRFELTLGACQVNAVSSIKVTLSRKLPSDTCEIQLPLLATEDLSKLKKGGAAVGGDVELKLGYDEPKPTTVFAGVITEVSPNQPLVIKCEDHAWALKQKRYTKTYVKRNPGPRSPNESWISEIGYDAISQAGLTPQTPIPGTAPGDQVKTQFQVNQHTCAQVLDALSDTGWDYFCVPGTKTVWFGPPWPWGQGLMLQERKFQYSSGKGLKTLGLMTHGPIINPESLKFTPADKIGKVVVYFVDSEHKKLAVKGEWPASGKDPIKEFSFAESLDDNAKEEAKKRARLLYNQLNSVSLEGDVQVFGNPYLKHSEEVIIKDPNHAERGGQGPGLSMWLDQVVHEYGPGVGFKTTLTLALPEEH